jgi:hypothetical protein
MSQAHGMAATIRSAQESETFDLAGQSSSTIEATIRSAFTEPFPLHDMIRITFITGAGKLARQKYDENAAKILTKVLNELGYVEDKGASCVIESQSCYKSQHDTGKNLKTIVVFPKLESVHDDDNVEGQAVKDRGPSVLDEGSPQQLIAMSNFNVFERMLASQCPSWSQKKQCVSVIGDIRAIVDSLDGKLLSGTPLTDSEQDFYDACDLTSLQKKEEAAKEDMQKCIDEGKITSNEKKKLLLQVREKLSSLTKEIEECANKPKKLKQLKDQQQRLQEREKKLESISPCPPHPLKFQSEIEKLKRELQPLLKLENETKGRLLTLKETTTLARKEDIELEILQLEEKSRGWFEEDEDFQLRIDASRTLAKSNANVVKKKTMKPTSAAGSGEGRKKAINFVVPGATAKRNIPSKSTAKKAPTNSFAAMMMDSDSDSD